MHSQSIFGYTFFLSGEEIASYEPEICESQKGERMVEGREGGKVLEVTQFCLLQSYPKVGSIDFQNFL